jgi:hypothetical protein
VQAAIRFLRQHLFHIADLGPTVKSKPIAAVNFVFSPVFAPSGQCHGRFVVTNTVAV